MSAELRELAEQLQNLCIARSTGGADDLEYVSLRHKLMANPICKDKLPSFVRTCRDANQFWHFIKFEDSTYAGRRTIIWTAFRPLMDHLEAIERSPGDDIVEKLLPELKSAYVTAIWQKALERRSTDPEGALTAARTLLETVCKLILDSARAGLRSRSGSADALQENGWPIELRAEPTHCRSFQAYPRWLHIGCRRARFASKQVE